jgi:nucleoside-diphosphate-sugar epimerase
VIARELLATGHSVGGLVRSNERAEAFASAGGTALLGSLRDLDVLRKGSDNANGIIHTAFGLDFSKIVELAEEDRQAIEMFGEVFAGSDRPIVVTSGIGLVPPGETLTEDSPRAPVNPAFPRASEQTAFALATRGLRASVVRLPRSTHGLGERHGFVPMLTALARTKGVSAYVGNGNNFWPSVHRLDAARVFCLAVERGAQNEAFHAVAEEAVPFRLIAEAIGRQVGVPAQSLTAEQATAHFGNLAMFVAGNGPATSEKTRAVLGWDPREIGLISDIDRPNYHE